MRPYAPAPAQKIPLGAPKRPWKPLWMGATNIAQEFKQRLPEFKEAGNFLLVTGGFVAADFIAHQLIPVTEGPKTANFYYGDKLIWTIPGLLLGRLLSDYVIKGSNAVRALTISTTCTALLQSRYLRTYPANFNLTVFLLHEAILFPLSFLITGPSPATGFY